LKTLFFCSFFLDAKCQQTVNNKHTHPHLRTSRVSHEFL